MVLSEIDAATNLLSKARNFFGKFSLKEKTGCDDYYYDEYNKKVYVNKNGDGLIVCSYILKVIDPVKTGSLIRTLDISDAKKGTEFAPFSEMIKAPIDNVFKDFGFWYRSDNDIITDVVEHYEYEDLPDASRKDFISIKLIIDTSKLEKGKTYKLMHAFSIPGLYPIKDGRFDAENIERTEYNEYRSYISTAHIGHHLRFALYFEEGIEFSDKPKGNLCLSSGVKRSKKNAAKKLTCVFKDNIFYKKYHFEIENPQEYSEIFMSWNIKNPVK